MAYLENRLIDILYMHLTMPDLLKPHRHPGFTGCHAKCPSCANPFPHGALVSPKFWPTNAAPTTARVRAARWCNRPGVASLRHADGYRGAPGRVLILHLERRAVPNAMDPPEHTGWRELVDRFFTPEQVAAQSHACVPWPTPWSFSAARVPWMP